MDLKRHFSINLLVYIATVTMMTLVNPGAIPGWEWSAAAGYFVILSGSKVPDLDREIEKHRLWLTHSCLLPLILVIALMNTPLWILAWFNMELHGMHLLCDLRIKKEKRVGLFTIIKPSGKRYNGKHSAEWLFWNGMACIMPSLLFLSAVL